MLTGLPYDGSVDWWCLGILLFQMMTGRSPFDHQDEGILFNMIQNRQLCTPSTFSKESQDIIRDLLGKDAKERLGCKDGIGEQEIRDHQFFFHINWKDLENGEATPPCKPTSVDANIAGNFASEFTDQSTACLPVKMEGILRKKADECFKGFSFNNDFVD